MSIPLAADSVFCSALSVICAGSVWLDFSTTTLLKFSGIYLWLYSSITPVIRLLSFLAFVTYLPSPNHTSISLHISIHFSSCPSAWYNLASSYCHLSSFSSFKYVSRISIRTDLSCPFALAILYLRRYCKSSVGDISTKS